ncbi:unnamed protein product [Symbiodinium sp. CCMP2592]|nr:unnamed protein product [Symbiodinium sp. CCMP2592]
MVAELVRRRPLPVKHQKVPRGAEPLKLQLDRAVFFIGERTEAPNQNWGRTAEPEKGKGKTGPSAGRPASESGSRTPRRGEKGAGKPTKGKPAKGAAQPAKGKAAQAKGAEQPAKGKPAPAGKSGKGKPATQEPEQGSGKKKNDGGGRSQAARANREARGAERREREGTDPVVLVEGPGTDIPEPRSKLLVPAPVFTGPAPGEDTPDFGGSNSEGRAGRAGCPPASEEAAAEPAEEAKPEASPKAAPKAAEAKEESSVSPSTEAGQEQAASAIGLTEATPEAEPKALPRGASQSTDGKGAATSLGLRCSRDDGEEEESEEESSEGQGPSSTPQEMSQQPAYPPPQGDPVVEAAIGELSAQRQQGLAAAAATAAVATAAPAPASQASGGGHLLKSMRLPTSLKGRDDWERFAFQAESYLAVVDTRYPAELEIARKCKAPLQMAAMTEEVRTLSVRLFGMLGSWTQDSATAVKLARGVKGQNGFELWRLLWQEHNPENESKNLTWRRTLLMPKFPPKESDFSLALQEWDADVDRYASEYGAGRALADEDLRAVLVTESPNALRQHLAMHAASLSTYAEVREVVVSYLQAKRVWTPSAGYAASSRRDPNTMDIGRIGDRDGKEGKGKGDKGKKGDKDHKKGKGDHDHKGKKGDKKGNQQGGRDGKERCPICWKTGHTVKECWFNAKGKGKGAKGQVAQVADDAATTVSTASLATAGPSASQAGGSTGGSGGKGQVRQVRDDRILGVRFAPPHDTEPEEEKILKVSGSLLVDSAACVSVCRPEAFPDLQPAGPPKSLYSVNFEVTEDIEDEILSISRAVEARTWDTTTTSRSTTSKEDAAMEAAADEEAEAAEEEEAAGNSAPLEEQAEQPDSRPRGLRAPRNPTAQERAEHELTHTPYQAWCEKCVEGKAREDPHRRREPSDDPVTPLVTMDVEEEASLATVLNLTDRATGWTLSVPVAHKGHRHRHAVYGAGLVEQFVDRLGYDKFTLQADQENAIASVARAVHRRLGAARVRLRDAPRGSHQSQGSVEGRNAHLAGEVRTWLSQLRADYPALEWDTSSNLFPWLVRHVAWLQARFGTKSTDGVSYRAATGTDYGGALCSFGETVLAKLPRPGNKAQVRWVKGVWAGKLERGADRGWRTQREERQDSRRRPDTRRQPSSKRAACLGIPDLETERLEPPGEPWLFSDGPRPDDELANAEIPDYEPSDVEAGPSAASALPQQAASPAPAANDGSGEGGQKRDSAGSSASAAAAQQPPAAKSRVEPKKAPRLGALTEREVWQHIAALADPPLTNHKVGQVTDLLDRHCERQSKLQAAFFLITEAVEVRAHLRTFTQAVAPIRPLPPNSAWARVWEALEWRKGYCWPPAKPAMVSELMSEMNARLKSPTSPAKSAFTPVLRSEVPRGAQLFRAKWVDKCDKGRYKSRCTCADVKARYSPEQEAGLDVFVPTPTPESHSLLEVAALHNEGWVTRSLDIVAAFLIGKDRGAAEGRPVYMHAPVEWRELFDQWVLEQPAKDQQWYRDHFRDFVFRVDGNLYGRRTAGSVYRDELEEVLTGKLAKDYDFQRGVKDPCVHRDRRSGLILLHHIDDIRVAGPKAAVLKFTEVDLPTHCEITVGELEEPGTAAEVLGRTKVRTEDSILTLPDSKHAENVCEQLGIGPKDKGTVPSRPLDLTKVEELSAGDAARFRSALGSAIYLSADRRDIQFAVKELARRMQNPRVCDWLAAETLARYLRATPRFGRVVVLDPASKSTAPLNLEVYSDSDWAGCPETRRSTDNIVACLGGSSHPDKLPDTARPPSNLRRRRGDPGSVASSKGGRLPTRACGEGLCPIACGVPRLWADSAASIGAAKRIGPGSKLRHLEVAEFFVQGALRAKLLELRKVKGTENPANFATKHAKTGPEVRQSLPSMGMVDLDAVAGATEALAQKGTIKSIQASPWKMRPPTKLASSALMATIVALQVRPAKAQGHDFAELVLGFAALVSWLCRCRRDRQEPEPEEEIEHHAERAEEPPRAAQRATEVWLGPEAPQEAQEERADRGRSQCGALPRWLLDFSCGVPEEVQEIMRTKDGKLTLFDVSGPPVRLLWIGAVSGLTFAISIPWLAQPFTTCHSPTVAVYAWWLWIAFVPYLLVMLSIEWRCFMYLVVPLMQWVKTLPGWPLPCFKQWANFTLPANRQPVPPTLAARAVSFPNSRQSRNSPKTLHPKLCCRWTLRFSEV